MANNSFYDISSRIFRNDAIKTFRVYKITKKYNDFNMRGNCQRQFKDKGIREHPHILQINRNLELRIWSKQKRDALQERGETNFPLSGAKLREPVSYRLLYMMLAI